MLRELKQFQLTCNSCSQEVVIQTTKEPELPKDWKTKEVFRFTGKSIEHYCPACIVPT